MEKNSESHSITTFQNGRDLLNSGFFDIVFLDIEMDGLNGIEAAQKLRLLGYNSRIIFLSSHQKYVFSAFDVSASHYLLKPLDTAKLEEVLSKITRELSSEKEHCYTVKCGSEIQRIPFSQIKFAEVFGRKVSLHTKQEVFTFNGRLDELAESFPLSFFRCHKSYLVNLAMVIKYDKESAILSSGESVPIARRKFGEFGKAFLAFLRKEGDM